MEHIQDKVSFLIIAGGNSSRMNYPKALLKYKNTTFLNQIYETCLSLNIPTYISLADKNQDHYTNNINIIKDKVIYDDIKDIGPLGALYSGFSKINTPYIFLLCVDNPTIIKEQIRYVYSYLNDYQNLSLISTLSNKIQPCFSIYHKSTIPVLKKCIENREYKLKNFIANIHHKTINIENTIFSNNFININTKEDYFKMLAIPFVFSISGYKNSYKTTLITKLIPFFKENNYKVLIIKHDGHNYELKENTDTYKYYKSNADQFLIYSNEKYTYTSISSFNIDDFINKQKNLDFIIIEGLKNSIYPKILINSSEYKKEEYFEIKNVFLNINKEEIIDKNIKSIFKQILKERDERLF